MTTQFEAFTIDETVSDSAETLVTTVSGQRKVVTAATFYNSDTSAVSLTLYRFASGGTAGATNIIATKTIPAGASWVCRELINTVVQNGQVIQGVAGTAAKINAHISGILEY